MGLFWLAIHPKHDKGTAASMDAWKGGRRLVPLPVAKNTGNSAHRRKVYGVRPIGQAHGAGSALTMCVNSTRDIITSPECLPMKFKRRSGLMPDGNGQRTIFLLTRPLHRRHRKSDVQG